MEQFVLERDCMAVLVPWGTPTFLKQGACGRIVQRLGGAFTVTVDGSMYRIEGRDADALGLQLPMGNWTRLEGGGQTPEQMLATAWEMLATCYDPEIPINIVELGLVYACEVFQRAEGNYSVDVRMTLTAPGCGMGNYLAQEVRQKLTMISGVEEANVELVWDPPWSREMMSEAAKLEAGMI